MLPMNACLRDITTRRNPVYGICHTFNDKKEFPHSTAKTSETEGEFITIICIRVLVTHVFL